MEELAEDLVEDALAGYPTLAAFTNDWVVGGEYSVGDSFEFGLDLIIEGLERASSRMPGQRR